MSPQQVAVESALLVLQGLVQNWVSQGKDPHVEAVRIAGIEGQRLEIDRELQAEVAKLPKTVPGSGV